METDPDAMARVARAWDEQHLDLRAAAQQAGSAPRTGFTPAVTGPAGRFVAAWEDHLADLAVASETMADGLRKTLTDLLRVDAAVAAEHVQLGTWLDERR